MLNKGLFSSATELWETPKDLFDRLNAKYHFETDVCAIQSNAKCPVYFTPEMDGLSMQWAGRCWMDPPYGRNISKWVKKAYDSAQENNALVVCLLPARTDTAWWHDYCMKGEIEFIRGRIKFSNTKSNAPFPSAIVIFRKDHQS